MISQNQRIMYQGSQLPCNPFAWLNISCGSLSVNHRSRSDNPQDKKNAKKATAGVGNGPLSRSCCHQGHLRFLCSQQIFSPAPKLRNSKRLLSGLVAPLATTSFRRKGCSRGTRTMHNSACITQPHPNNIFQSHLRFSPVDC